MQDLYLDAWQRRRLHSLLAPSPSAGAVQPSSDQAEAVPHGQTADNWQTLQALPAVIAALLDRRYQHNNSAALSHSTTSTNTHARHAPRRRLHQSGGCSGLPLTSIAAQSLEELINLIKVRPRRLPVPNCCAVCPMCVQCAHCVRVRSSGTWPALLLWCVRDVQHKQHYNIMPCAFNRWYEGIALQNSPSANLCL